MSANLDVDRLVDRITDQIFQKRGCDGCKSAHGGARNCDQAGDGAAAIAAEAAKALDRILALGVTRISTKCRLGQDRADLAGRIDHTQLKPDATKDELVKICEEAARHGFWSVCVNPAYVSFCKKLLEGTKVLVCTVIGFPLGQNTPETKAFEAEIAQRDGATELDMVINVGALKSKEYAYVEADIRAVVQSARPGVLVKVILETCLLTDEEIVKGCELAQSAGAHFVKTSTGFSSGGAKASDIALMRRVVGDSMGVKASGGVRDANRADLLVEAGADRIGASASVEIVRGKPATGKGY